MTGAQIEGIGTAVPRSVLDNAELSRRVDTNDDWIVRRTGIKERRIAAPHETTSSLAVAAAERALADAGVPASTLDAVILATSSPDRSIPPASCLVQTGIGATNAVAFDLNAACAGFLTGLITAGGLIASGRAGRALVVGAEVLSRFVNPHDRTTVVLFGDGAGAMVLGRSSSDDDLLAHDWGADGTGADALAVDAGGSAEPASPDSVAHGRHFIRMNGPEVYRAAVRAMSESAQETLRRGGVSVADVDLLVCHQANQRIIDETGRRLGIPSDRVFSNVASYGNTSAASIPLALAEARDQGLIRDGSLVLATTVGAGFTWASLLIRWRGGTR